MAFERTQTKSQLIDNFVDSLNISDRERFKDYTVVYMLDGEPYEELLQAYPGSDIKEKLQACANEVEEVIYLVDNDGKQFYI